MELPQHYKLTLAAVFVPTHAHKGLEAIADADPYLLRDNSVS